MKNINIPKEARYIINKLNEKGYKAYIVGGCVRDSLMDILPDDWDITTSASPTIVKETFKYTYDTGIKHGTVTVAIDYKPYEVTTFRIDGEYFDNRRPSEVSFSQEIIEDLKRRDFTMNAVAYHPLERFIDPFGGMQDISNKLIRCVGDPNKRFKEDALRMLRAIRFYTVLNFDIHEQTKIAIYENSYLIKNISGERIREELNKILLSNAPSKIMLMYELNLLKYILPEFEECIITEQNHPYHSYNVGLHSLKAVESVRSDIALRWTMLLHDIGKPPSKTTDEDGIDHFYGHEEISTEITRKVLNRLKFDNKTAKKIITLVKFHDRHIEANHKAVRKAIRVIGEDIFLDFLEVKRADAKAQNPDVIKERLAILDNIEEIYYEIKEADNCLSIKDLAINGMHLIEIGISEGKEIGIILNNLLEAVLENPDLNEKEILLDIVKKLKNNIQN